VGRSGGVYRAQELQEVFIDLIRGFVLDLVADTFEFHTCYEARKADAELLLG
jgi:hypothetical protein